MVPDSPAAAAGIQAGDVILEFDGREVAEAADLPPIVGRTAVGETVEVVVLREGERRTLEVEVGALSEYRDTGGADDGSGGFLVMLNRIAPEMDGKGSIEPRAISYRQGRLELELFADSLQHIDNIKKAIDARDGLSAEVRSTNTEGDKVRARLVIDEVSQ